MMLKTLCAVAIIAGGMPAASFAWGEHNTPQSTATPNVLGPPGDKTDLGDLIYVAAQTLVERAGVLAKDRPVVVTTMVSINDFSKSSTFGRLASQLISDRINQRGYAVRDLNYTGALSIRQETGELVLSRDASRISAEINAQAVVAGTYAVSGREIYLSIRLIEADDGMLLSSADVVIPLDHNTEPLVLATNQPSP
jgi:TolB-like protein